MNSHRGWIVAVWLVALLSIFGGVNTVWADVTDSTAKPTQLRSKPMIGLKIGTMFGGKVDIEDVDTLSSHEFIEELDPGLSFGAYFEFSSPAWTTAGISFEMHKITPSDYPESRWMYDIGIVIKSSMRKPGQQFAVRPMLGISYGYIPGVDSVATSGSFMVAKIGAETVYFPAKSRVGLSVEACLIASPFGRAFSDGGDHRYDIAARLRPMLRAGIVLR
jgi:hypothetical protein